MNLLALTDWPLFPQQKFSLIFPPKYIKLLLLHGDNIICRLNGILKNRLLISFLSVVYLPSKPFYHYSQINFHRSQFKTLHSSILNHQWLYLFYTKSTFISSLKLKPLMILPRLPFQTCPPICTFSCPVNHFK